MSPHCIPDPDGVIHRIDEDGDTDTIIQTIMYADQRVGEDVACISARFNAGDTYSTCKRIWRFIIEHIDYVRDELGDERIKSPAQTWNDGYADCKSMALFAAAILKNLGIKHKYRFASYDDNKTPTHVYLVVGSTNIVLDPVSDEKFNHEKGVTFYKDYKGFMPKVTYMHGTPSRKAPGVITDRSASRRPIQSEDLKTRADRVKDAPKKVRKKPFINFVGMTSGELKTVLLKEQIDIAKEYYGEQAGNLDRASELLTDALENNLHRNASNILPSSLPDDINYVGRSIQEFSRDTKSATSAQIPKNAASKMNEQMGVGGLFSQGIGANEWKFSTRDSIIDRETAMSVLWNCLSSIDSPEFDEMLSSRGINNRSDFIDYFSGYSAEDLEKWVRVKLSYPGASYFQDVYECANAVELMLIFNEKFEDSSHHILYEFLDMSLNEAPQSAAIKKANHTGVTDAFRKIAGFDRSIIRMWAKNGIMRSNANADIEPFTPTETIQQIMEGAELEDVPSVQEMYQNRKGMGGFLGVVAAVVGVLVSAVEAAGPLIQLLNKKPKGQLLNQFQNVGTPSFSATPEDFSSAEGNEPGGGFKAAFPAVAAAGAGLFMFMD